MSTLTTLINSDTVIIDSISYQLSGPEQINPGIKNTGLICINKIPGQLRFKLNSKKDFNFNFSIDIDIEFIGTAVGVTPAGDNIVEWTVDQTIDKDISVDKLNVHIDRIYGDVLTLVRNQNPRLIGNSCSGVQRSFGINIETIPGNNLTIAASLFGIGITVQAQNISFFAKAGDDFKFSLKIVHILDECGLGGTVPNGTSRFYASVSNITVGDTVTYYWNVSGAIVIGGNTNNIIEIQLGQLPNPIKIDLTVSINGVENIKTIFYTPDTELISKAKTFYCRYRHFLRVNRFFDPLEDPLRISEFFPYDEKELQEILAFAKELESKTSELLTFLKEISYNSLVNQINIK